mmetsp:Transcript_28984/g.40727  ORF Transcript_28984/g.40727 Transcript_28984/m.40727 type:complete len:615 (-) Transcript_28984:302-2146(-)
MTYDGVQPRENYGLNPQNGLFDQIVFSMDTNGKKQPPQLWIQTKAPSWTSMHRQGYVPNPARKRMLKVWRASEGDDFKLGEMRMIDGVTAPTSMETRPGAVAPASPPQAPITPAAADTASKPAEKTKKKRKRTEMESESEKGEKPEEEAAKIQTDVPVEKPPPAKKSKTTKDDSKSAAPSKGKNIKDPNAPKKPPSAYILYSKSIREEVKTANPEAKFTDMSKLTGDKWKQLSAESKKEWNEKANAEKEKYKAVKENYDTEAKKKAQAETKTGEEPTGTEDEVAKEGGSATTKASPVKVTTKKKTSTKDPNAPKRPKPSYIHYQNKRRPILAKENPGTPFGDIARMIGAEWKELTEDVKKIYTLKADQDKKRYEEEMITYVPPTVDEGEEALEEAEKKKRKKRKKRKKKDPNAPKAPLSAYILFSNWKRADIQEKNPESSFLSMGKKLGEEWGKLSDAEKQKWKDKAKIAQAEYEKDLEAYEAKNVAEQEVSAATLPKTPKTKKSKKVKNGDKESDEALVAPPKSPPSKNLSTPGVRDTPSPPSKSAPKKNKAKKLKKKDTTASSDSQAETPAPSKESKKTRNSTKKASAKSKEDAVTPSTPSTSVRRSKRSKK